LGAFGPQGSGSQQQANNIISGVGVSLNAYAGLSAVGVTGLAVGGTASTIAVGGGAGMMGGEATTAEAIAGTAATGIGVPIAAAIAISAGIYAMTSGMFNKKKPDNSAYLAAQAARAAQVAEGERKTSISALQQRETALAHGAGGGMTAQQRKDVQPQLAAFQRRPTYQSRIGLADSAERAIGSAIHPKW
jgi:hypothetical protein